MRRCQLAALKPLHIAGVLMLRSIQHHQDRVEASWLFRNTNNIGWASLKSGTMLKAHYHSASSQQPHLW
jgi:hypothetical protein